MSRKPPKLPPLHLQHQQQPTMDAFSRCKKSLRSVPNPPEMAIEDLSDDVRDLVIGSPIPQISRDNDAFDCDMVSTSMRNLCDPGWDQSCDAGAPPLSPDCPAIRVDSLENKMGTRGGNKGTSYTSNLASSRQTTYATGSSESFDDHRQISDCRRLSPSPKLYRKTDNNHVKYFRVADNTNTTADCNDPLNEDSTLYELSFNTMSPYTTTTMSPTMSPTKQTRLSPILSPSSVSPNHSPRISPASSPRTPRRKREQISINSSPVPPRKSVNKLP